ncbi:MAG TPA: endonuclease, partial [Arthrobacter sp.]
MESRAGVEGLEAFEASVAALVSHVRRGAGGTGSTGPDPLREQADACLDGLAESARVEAMLAAVKVHLTDSYAEKAAALASPAVTPQEHTAQEMAVVACVLTVSERAAGALLAESRELSTALPLTLAALQDGSISWQHARIMVDETANLGPAGAAALEAHFLDPDAPNPARG